MSGTYEVLLRMEKSGGCMNDELLNGRQGTHSTEPFDQWLYEKKLEGDRVCAMNAAMCC